MVDEERLQLELTPRERTMLEMLREELGLDSEEEAMRLILRQAFQRLTVTCPTCGHNARVTDEDVAHCASCLSILRLSEGLWMVARKDKP
jgi:hypothetical protein